MGDKATFEITVEFEEEVDEQLIEDYVYVNFVPKRDDIQVTDAETGETLFSNKD